MHRLFADIDAADYCLVSFRSKFLPIAEGGPKPLPAITYRLPTDWTPTDQIPSDYPLRRIRATRKFTAEVLRRARRIAILARREQCGAILVTTSMETVDVPAAALAARITGLPLFIYMLDNWRYMLRLFDPVFASVDGVFQSAILAGSRCVIAQNPFMANEIKRENGRDCVVVGIPVPRGTRLGEVPSQPWPSTPGELKIVFTGNVYMAHFDALARVLEALESPRLQHASLHIYGGSVKSGLHDQGLVGRMHVHGHVSGEELTRVQREADILLQPMAWESPSPQIVMAAAPTKTAEYLASGRPMLIHAPPGSYLAQLARDYEVAALVDQPDARAIEEAILRIEEDAEFRARVTANALRAADRLYSPAATVERLVNTFNALVGGQAA